MSRKKDPGIVATSQKFFKVTFTLGLVLAVGIFVVFTAIQWKNEPDRPMATGYNQSSSTMSLVKLEPGVWLDLRKNGILLPNKRLDIDFVGCIEVSINGESSKKVCDGNTKLPNGEKTDSNLEYGSDIYQMKIRGITEGAYATVTHS